MEATTPPLMELVEVQDHRDEAPYVTVLFWCPGMCLIDYMLAVN